MLPALLMRMAERDYWCSFSQLFECNHPTAYAATAVSLILDIPFMYYMFYLIRTVSINIRTSFVPGTCFCACKVLSDISSVFYFYLFWVVYHQVDQDAVFRWNMLIYDCKYLAIACYFNNIATILRTIGTKFSYILVFITVAFKYYFSLLIVAKVILMYVPSHRESALLVFFYRKYHFINENHVRMTMYCISFICLSICFILSNAKTYFPKKLHTPMKISIFLIAFFFFTGTCVQKYMNSPYYLDKDITNPKPHIIEYTILWLLRAYLEDYNLLAIIIYLSFQDKSSDQSHDNAISEGDFQSLQEI